MSLPFSLSLSLTSSVNLVGELEAKAKAREIEKKGGKGQIFLIYRALCKFRREIALNLERRVRPLGVHRN